MTGSPGEGQRLAELQNHERPLRFRPAFLLKHFFAAIARLTEDRF